MCHPVIYVSTSIYSIGIFYDYIYNMYHTFVTFIVSVPPPLRYLIYVEQGVGGMMSYIVCVSDDLNDIYYIYKYIIIQESFIDISL